MNEQQDKILELLNKDPIVKEVLELSRKLYKEGRLECWHLYLTACTRNNIPMVVPFSKFIEVYDRVNLEQFELTALGYTIEVGELTEQQKKDRMAPNITKGDR